MTDFHLLDLPSQAAAVQALLRGTPDAGKIDWLSAHGSVEPTGVSLNGVNPVYQFTSRIGMKCVFFLKGDVFVFVRGHTTYTVS